MSTTGLKTPGRGYSLATSSYVAICSRSKSSFSVKSYMIFLVLGWRQEELLLLAGRRGEPGGVVQSEAHDPAGIWLMKLGQFGRLIRLVDDEEDDMKQEEDF